MKEVVIAGYKRSPFCLAHRGELTHVRPDDMIAHVIKGLMAENYVPLDTLEGVILGCAFPEGEQGLNIARLSSFLSGLPHRLFAVTLNQFCGSSMQAVHVAASQIAIGAGDAFICGGVESMSRVPMSGFNPMPHPKLYHDYPASYISMGETAENVAKKYNVSRLEQEEFALKSHQKALRALRANAFAEEIVPITHDQKVIQKDGCIREDTTLEKLGILKPAFDKQGTVTAGTSSPLTDGATALIVCSLEYAKNYDLKPLAKICSIASAGCDPEIMGMGPVAASQKALKRAGLSIDHIDVVELNEAFSSQSIACVKELGIAEEKLNIDGGAIALGHPLGATGGRLLGKAALLLQRESKKFALATQCIGGGQGIATIMERIEW